MDEPVIDFKFVEAFFKDKFARPFIRRLKYMYFGLDHAANTFVLSDTEDTEFKFCDATQSTGLVRVLNNEHLDKLNLWFAHMKIDRTKPYIFHFNRLMTLLNKTKWNDPTITTTLHDNKTVTITIPGLADEVVIASIIDAHYTLTRLQTFVKKYSDVLLGDDAFLYHDVKPHAEKTEGFILVPVSAQELLDKGLVDRPCEDIKIVLLEGLDLLVVKSLSVPDHAYQFEIRLWADNGLECINFGSYYKDANIAVCASRDNIFVFPPTKRTS